MQSVYQRLHNSCTELRANTLNDIYEFLLRQGYENKLFATLEPLLYNDDDPDPDTAIQHIIIRCGCQFLEEAGIEADLTVAYNSPVALYHTLTSINETIELWEDYEGLLDAFQSDTAYDLATIIAIVSGDAKPTQYMDLIIRVQDRVFSTIRKYLEYRIQENADQNPPERIPSKIIDLVRLYIKRFTGNRVADMIHNIGIYVPDEQVMRSIDYEYEPAMPAPYQHQIAVCAAGLIIRRAQYLSEAYPLIEHYVQQLTDTNAASDIIKISKETNSILESLYKEVENEEA